MQVRYTQRIGRFNSFFCLVILIVLIVLRSEKGGKRVDDCTPCDEGKFCNDTGLTQVTGDCSPGYYCRRGSPLSEPNNGTHGGLCPKGNYCGKGSKSPDNPCKEGKLDIASDHFISTILGGESLSVVCVTCPPTDYFARGIFS